MAVATPLPTSAPDPRAERAQRPMAQLPRGGEAGRAPPAGDCLTVSNQKKGAARGSIRKPVPQDSPSGRD